MLRHFAIGFALLGAAGCSKSDPGAERRAATEPGRADSADAPIQPKLTEEKLEDPRIQFDSVEAEIAYWQNRAIADVKKRFVKVSETEIQKMFDELKPYEQASVQRIRTWLPHKRISEMGNAGEDVLILTNNAAQFDPELAIKRLLEFADDSGAPTLIKNLGIKAPRAMVWFCMDFGQLAPDAQSLIWGINEKLRAGGISSLTPTERALVQARPGLFPPPP